VIIGLPVTIVLAHFSYRYFEKPFLRLKERFEVVQSRAA
jgi:peptidoglycan/LPS O-acetylase OafA/YrhL